MYKLAILLCCFATLVIPVLSVTQCRQCEYFDKDKNSTTNNDRCKDDPTAVPLVNCNGTLPDGVPQPDFWQCVKVTGRIEIDEENHNLWSRFCRAGNNTKAECKETKSYETSYGSIKRGTSCVCDDKDGCNTGTSVVVGAITLGAGLIVTVFSRI